MSRQFAMGLPIVSLGQVGEEASMNEKWKSSFAASAYQTCA